VLLWRWHVVQRLLQLPRRQVLQQAEVAERHIRLH
jgi:hypothetical protein